MISKSRSSGILAWSIRNKYTAVAGCDFFITLRLFLRKHRGKFFWPSSSFTDGDNLPEQVTKSAIPNQKLIIAVYNKTNAKIRMMPAATRLIQRRTLKFIFDLNNATTLLSNNHHNAEPKNTPNTKNDAAA